MVPPLILECWDHCATTSFSGIFWDKDSSMQFKGKPKKILNYENKRNKLVCKLLEEDKFLSSRDALKKANKIMRLETRAVSNKFHKYERRSDCLSFLGFASYQDYLDSPVWYKIRELVLAKYMVCFCCDKEATQIHHLKYSSGVLLGFDTKKLVPICGDCHKEIEFTDGVKNSMDDANIKVHRMMRDGVGKVRVTIPWRMRRDNIKILKAAKNRKKFGLIKEPVVVNRCKKCSRILRKDSDKCTHCTKVKLKYLNDLFFPD